MSDFYLRAAMDMLNIGRPDIAADLIKMHDAETKKEANRIILLAS